MAQKKEIEPAKLPGDVTIYGVGALRSQFSSSLESLPTGRKAAGLENTPLIIDASGVSEVDAAGVQLLIAFSKSLAQYKRPLQIVNPSDPLVGAFETLGVTFP